MWKSFHTIGATEFALLYCPFGPAFVPRFVPRAPIHDQARRSESHQLRVGQRTYFNLDFERGSVSPQVAKMGDGNGCREHRTSIESRNSSSISSPLFVPCSLSYRLRRPSRLRGGVLGHAPAVRYEKKQGCWRKAGIEWTDVADAASDSEPSGDFEAESSCGSALSYSPSAGALRLLGQWKMYDLGTLPALRRKEKPVNGMVHVSRLDEVGGCNVSELKRISPKQS
ncbi:uncharacterized protein B0H18DRAFT_27237 [Fomitopsis serialis]|uniref:uncharacterized protein n=1 Tax=Fomitopsis serialis TaxID=139415 RepID=UPI00200792AE|nr:uncharacterized protein B0H18DRAFT_27237 [Neoantrodia serialis]KAH9932502.1 hypothetical protein B0H18DRAFT_27237 [Neoantrodia serialis]